jgi:hypothetical protein
LALLVHSASAPAVRRMAEQLYQQCTTLQTNAPSRG